MDAWMEIATSVPAIRALRERLVGDETVEAHGAWGGGLALALAAAGALDRRPGWIWTPGREEAERLARDLHTFLPDRRVRILEGARGGSGRLGREGLFADLAAGRVDLLILPAAAWVEGFPPLARIEEGGLHLRPGDRLDPRALVERLEASSLERVPMVERSGEYAARGGIVDLFAPPGDLPIRVEFEDDRVVSVRTFDPVTQRASTECGEAEAVLGRGGMFSAADTPGRAAEYLPADSFRAVIEPAAFAERLAREGGTAGAAPRRVLGGPGWLRIGPFAETSDSLDLGMESVTAISGTGRDPVRLRALADLAVRTGRLLLFVTRSVDAERFDALVAEGGVALPDREVHVGFLSGGFRWDAAGILALPYDDLLGRTPLPRSSRPRPFASTPVDDFLSVRRGTHVVHRNHGIALYRGMERVARQGTTQEFLRLEFAEKAFLLVPIEQADLVGRYVGAGQARPELSRLGGGRWKRTRERVERATEDLAAQMLRIQAIRASRPGIPHPPDDPMQRAFEASFPYEETPDQVEGMEEIRIDMERSRPMDRLLCGDVGFGKTELAMRAAFKVVTGGRQVAVLVPTTVLALQHFRTFSARMADTPVRVEMLSRVRTVSEQAGILETVAAGEIDILIGTHRILSEDVRFRDLGLVILDEEQRFGVAQKQRLLGLRAEVDVLTMTATPIPRTLHMAMTGLRDISTLAVPPADRMAIQTRAAPFTRETIREAIRHELARDGQVYFLHNRVHSIVRLAERLREWVPEARIAVGHGRLPREALERVMVDFIDRKADVLLATTIIESGLDIPNVNTILIDRADRFGLAELHQLRGRVGRFDRQAYCILLLPEGRPVAPRAAARIKALQEYAELGTGFRIALRDLEIRGAGNLLGPEQSGHIGAVGYDLYCQLLERSVHKLKGEPVPEGLRCTIDLPVEAYLPESYVCEGSVRLGLYRRLARADSVEAVDRLDVELRDRFGPVPPAAVRWLDLARLRIEASRRGVTAVRLSDDGMILACSDPAAASRLDGDGLRELDRRTRLLPLSTAGRDPAVLLLALRQILDPR